MPQMNLQRTNTDRGFALIRFTDRYNNACSLQMSSLATEPAIWFGVQDAVARVMARDASAVSVQTDKMTGWVEYPIPKEVLISTRMHLTQEHVKQLLPVLQRFADTGEL